MRSLCLCRYLLHDSKLMDRRPPPTSAARLRPGRSGGRRAPDVKLTRDHGARGFKRVVSSGVQSLSSMSFHSDLSVRRKR